jgi:hypothetical protein
VERFRQLTYTDKTRSVAAWLILSVLFLFTGSSGGLAGIIFLEVLAAAGVFSLTWLWAGRLSRQRLNRPTSAGHAPTGDG